MVNTENYVYISDQIVDKEGDSLELILDTSQKQEYLDMSLDQDKLKMIVKREKISEKSKMESEVTIQIKDKKNQISEPYTF